MEIQPLMHVKRNWPNPAELFPREALHISAHCFPLHDCIAHNIMGGIVTFLNSLNKYHLAICA